MTVYVVTGVHLGWDCIVGVFTVDTKEEYDRLYDTYPEDEYVISERRVEKWQ